MDSTLIGHGASGGGRYAALSTSAGMHILKAGFAYFALVFGAGFLLGAVRVPFLVPRLGMRTAELLEAPIMLCVVVLAARFVVRRFSLRPRATPRLLVGVVALALLLLAEFAVVVLVQRQALGAYIASRDPVAGSVYLGMLALFAAMPLLLRGRGNEQASRHQVA